MQQITGTGVGLDAARQRPGRNAVNYLIVNPGAGNAAGADFWRTRLAEHGIAVQVMTTGADTEFLRLTADDRLIVAGGDGTMSRYAALAVDAGCTLGVLPAGTGNDFARGLGVPLEPDAACRNLRDGVPRQVDVGVIGDGLFLNVAHIGLGAEVTRSLHSDDKHWWGRFAYLRALVERVTRARGFRAGIRVGGKTLRGRWLQISIANGRSFGGGQQFFDADPFDGRLDLVAVRPKPLWVLFMLWLSARARGRPPRHEALVRLRDTHFEILAHSRRPVTADGELCAHLPVRIGIRKAALSVILPPGEARPAANDDTDGEASCP